MKVQLNSIVGIDDAIAALYVSKRHLDTNFEKHIRNVIKDPDSNKYEYDQLMKKLLKYGTKHVTLLRFIDLSFTVRGLHRFGRDDWDSHAKRFDNRIIRDSTRLASFGTEEISDYYKDKIISTDLALSKLDISIPDVLVIDGIKYLKVVNGYIREDLASDQDIRRGLYMGSIPTDFIFRVNLAEFAHIYKLRNKNTSANPEVQELAEECMRLINEKVPEFTSELMLEILN